MVKDFTARKQGEDIFLKSPVSDAEQRFARIVAAVAWGNPVHDDAWLKDHAAVIAGQRHDGHVSVFREFIGGLDALFEALVEWKDNCYCQRIYIPRESPELMKDVLYRRSGLTAYPADGWTKYGTPIWRLQPQDEWQNFRSPDHVAHLYDTLEAFDNDFDGARQIVDRLAKVGKVGTAKMFLPTVEKHSAQKTAASSEVPAVRAYVTLCWHLWHEFGEKQAVPRPQQGTGAAQFWRP